ncbi:hypothetical protein J7T55_013512 [Diaporthe amygdali]|uniref:uncharacterized protein n=1 Tax=Phomopsis amygdali TaxID=1214568 RepID=UPI0022FE0E5D|nr:uncharacterized protein J7T55_013512 [Diaporthe amygdali]KAJ0119275.1 hypothetical protein J7T55_013512 [Diaporthe amygdali]
MHFQAALSVAIFGASAFADVSPRQNSCVMCTEQVPECPVCPANQECFISDPADCTECPQAYCAVNAADATPTPTPILGSTSSSSADFSLPTISESETATASATTTAASGSTTASGSSSTGASGESGSATATASAPGASSSAPSSASGRNADVGGMLRVALLVAVPVLGFQGLW